MTYSILGLDPQAGQIGVAVQSHFFAVGSQVAWARPGVGVIATQALVEPTYGSRGLELLAAGASPQDALDALLAADPHADTRQVAMLTVSGDGATHTGAGCIGFAGHAVSAHARAQANLVASTDICAAMTDAFESAVGPLAERLIAALCAAEEHGGDLRGQQAAALRVVRTEPTGNAVEDVVVDLRVDDAVRPLDELARLLIRSRALAGLLRLLQTPGLLTGEFRASEPAVAAALDELDRAQALAGPDNTEPLVWKGLLLARAGRTEEARVCFGAARRTIPRLGLLLRRLAAAGMWTRGTAELDALMPDR
ncbi:Uncharacterized conserved protein, Ntn-hydrolase superfamily [Pseudonocardia thermophila]|jgi:Uncharacterized conserved protein|uniref:Uncharacterized conserved protein, Ntn-hydrolase superfamily n=1 Tax=Pseudonocardia thermophila TaxID=1848 RepID=A0A1M6WUP2_PSETH|nr:DUF1028 domain-containing protein [Pseudonocardia thermophila]SHK97376.1 Uncharacterized conserved protein, Ntn-hydrolase superfamily [Pseudonocardia thermophila]